MEIPVLELNSEQNKAAFHVEGPLLVLAGAGSGKTRIIIARILHLLRIGIPSTTILAVTFTNKAAAEMKHRILQLAKTQVLTSTFHSLCARILKESIGVLGYERDFVIADEEDSEKILKQCFTALGIKEDKNLLRSTRTQISQSKNQFLFPEDLPANAGDVKALYSLYQKQLQQYNFLDFDDLLFLTVRLFKEHPNILTSYQKKWNFILIDEYQDTNHAQYLLIQQLSAFHRNVFAVGDPDQSIYSWRGANIQNILQFEKDYEGAQIVRLEQNYRSCNNILNAANALIKNNEGRYEKNLWSHKEEGEKIRIFIADNERKEGDFVAQQIHQLHNAKKMNYKDCAIFYRTNFQSRTFEDALLRENIPYIMIGGLSFYQRKEIKDILSFLRMGISNTDFLSFSRTINLPRRGFGSIAIQKIQELQQEYNKDIFSLCQELVEGKIDGKFSTKQKSGLADYMHIIQALRNRIQANIPLDEILADVISRSGYLDYLKEEAETFEDRKTNVQELVAKAMEWKTEAPNPTLVAFLEELALRPSSDDPSKEIDAVRLMTLHNGKGLEFSLVFLVGLEEDLFPHINAKDSASLLEEERRLCYVGLTRAKDFLFLTAAYSRFLWGTARNMRPSRFLKEIPSQFCKSASLPSKAYEPHTYIQKIEEQFQVGDTVFHKSFGTGTVRKVYQTSLGLTYDVSFSQTQALRSLAAKYAKLEAR